MKRLNYFTIPIEILGCYRSRIQTQLAQAVEHWKTNCSSWKSTSIQQGVLHSNWTSEESDASYPCHSFRDTMVFQSSTLQKCTQQPRCRFQDHIDVKPAVPELDTILCLHTRSNLSSFKLHRRNQSRRLWEFHSYLKAYFQVWYHGALCSVYACGCTP